MFYRDKETVNKDELCAKIIPFNIKRKGSSYITRALPHKSSRGNLYVTVMYDYDSNAILAKPIKNRQAETIRDGLLKIHKILKSRGSDPKVYIMDNECYSDLMDFQLASPHRHRQNAEEQAIITCKNHFISGFSTTDPDLPIREWDRLLSKCIITLNLIRDSRFNPALSAYVHLFGPYDFNKSPVAPSGTRVIVHYKPGNCTSWGHNGTKGWYIGTSLDHYRCM